MGLPQKESLSEDGEKMEKCCSDCKTTKTPLWRGGPAGPKSLCNACGIRFRKRRSSVVGPSRGGTEKRKERTTLSPPTPAVAADTGTVGDGGLGESLKMGLMALTKEVLMQQQRSSSSSSSYLFSSPVKKQRSRRKLREEEQAAVLLMSLSCGSIFA